MTVAGIAGFGGTFGPIRSYCPATGAACGVGPWAGGVTDTPPPPWTRRSHPRFSGSCRTGPVSLARVSRCGTGGAAAGSESAASMRSRTDQTPLTMPLAIAGVIRRDAWIRVRL
jgi:hypothetical protein